MFKSLRQLSVQNNYAGIRAVLFFLLFFLYLWLEVDTRLIYHTGGQSTTLPVFYKGWEFFAGFLSYPGGLVEYLAGLLVQSFYFSFAGALVIMAVAWLLYLTTDNIIRTINAPALRWIRFVPPILILITYTRYFHFFGAILALLIALIFVNVYLKVSRYDRFNGLALVLESVLLYYIASGAFLLFAAICIIYESFFARRWRLCVACAVLAMVIPYVYGLRTLDTPAFDTLANWVPVYWRFYVAEGGLRMMAPVFILYLFLPVTLLGAGLVRLFRAGRAKSTTAEPDINKTEQQAPAPSPLGILSRYKNTKLARLFGALLVFIVTAATLLVFRDRQAKAICEVDYYLYHKNWSRVIEAAGTEPDNPLIIHAADQALYHMGRLNDDLFKYHSDRRKADALFLSSEQLPYHFWNKGNFYLKLGLINFAEHNLTVALETRGELPVILKQLAYIRMVKGDIDSARVFLKALRKTFFHAECANEYLSRLKADPGLSNDIEIQQLRSLTMREDRTFKHGEFEKGLYLLEGNTNRMAFEYRMAVYLLQARCEKIVQNLALLKKYNYLRMPRLWEEAVLIYEHTTKTKIDLHGYRISRATQQRFQAINQADKVYGNRQLAMKELSKKYGDSFILYYLKAQGQKR